MGDPLRGKIAIVTGAASAGPGWGNGKASAVLFAREGAKVLCVDRAGKAQATVDLIRNESGEAEAFDADVTVADQVKAVVEHCVGHFGRIDILHNNVGIHHVGGPSATPGMLRTRCCFSLRTRPDISTAPRSSSTAA